MLRVDNLRFTRRQPEEGGIEELRVIQHGPGPHVVRVDAKGGWYAGSVEVGVAERAQRLDPVGYVAPERVEVNRVREAAREPDNRHGMWRH